ncbi:unnamed protein product [Rhizophagus irregularis]|nr:unnamed protein product [Rhizophagus irregularis]
MTKVLYPNRSSWAKTYTPFQFNAGIQSTQSVELFNAIIKKTLNSASNLCEIGNTIDKRHEDELQYCKLVNLKAHQTTVGLPHLSSQFFSSIDIVLNHFLTPLVLLWQKFQISQSFTYEGCLISSLDENLDIETASDNFIEDIIDEPQITIKSLLSGIEISNIIKIWKIRRIGGLSRKYNIVILLDDGTHLCTYLETITKAIETTTDTSTLSQITLCTFQSLHCIQGSDNNEVIRQNTNQRNRFGIAFSTAKTAVNIALETNSDHELIQLLKDFIEAKREKNVDTLLKMAIF